MEYDNKTQNDAVTGSAEMRAVAGVHFFILCRYVQLFLCYYKRLLVVRKLVVRTAE